MEVVFRNPFYLWSLLVVPIIILAHFLSLKYSKQRAIKFANFVALARVSEKVRLTSNFFLLFLRIVVFVAIVFAITGTTLFYTGERVDADYVIVIDSSASMLAEDFLPNRFEAAKDAAINFVDNLPVYSSAGIISFSGISYVQQPLTVDKNLLRNVVTDLNIMSSGGTSIGDSVITGTNLLMNSWKPKLIIILTDGRSNLGVGREVAIRYANNNNVIVSTIGIGTEEGPAISFDDQLVPLGINIEELTEIATMTGGTFYHPQSNEDLKNVYEEIARSKKTKVSLDLTFFLMIFILFAFVVEWVLINTRYKIIP